MDLRSLDDLIALAESGSLTAAAARRNVTQPAFSRRIRTIEQLLGVQVMRRDIKPARASATLLQNIDTIRAQALALRRLRSELVSSANPERALAIAAPHAIATAELPPLVRRLHSALPFSRIRLRAANRDQCFGLLMTGQVGIMLSYETARTPQPINDDLVEKVKVRGDRLIPVCTAGLAARLDAPVALPVLAYPDTSLLGTILRDEILPMIARRYEFVASSSYSPAIAALAEEGLGIAWLPEHLVAAPLGRGDLVSVAALPGLPVIDLSIAMLRVRGDGTGFTNTAWTTLLRLFAA